MNINVKREMRAWKVGAIDRQLWSEKAQRGTLLISQDEDDVRALLVDDQGGVRAAFQVPPAQIPEVIATATKAWIERGMPGSFNVYTETRSRGSLTPPPPPPPPGPGGHGKLQHVLVMQTLAGHGSFNVAAELADLTEFGDLPQQLTGLGR
jgi:hypothetical protein